MSCYEKVEVDLCKKHLMNGGGMLKLLPSLIGNHMKYNKYFGSQNGVINSCMAAP